ncbi:MAG: hypothetical protein ABH858_04825 [Candidatus Omnitrophota bacterium]
MRVIRIIAYFVPALFIITPVFAQPQHFLPALACDFYGVEESAGNLHPGMVITAVDSNGVLIGTYTVTTAGRYGFFTCLSDLLSTAENEGSLDGDTITFYIDGVKQQEQGVFKSGQTVRVDLGVAAAGDTFNLHLFDMPGYTNYNQAVNYSGVAVSDMILDFLVPANTDSQQDLLLYADKNGDNQTSSGELERMLNEKSPYYYNFGSTSTIKRYSDYGYIGSFDPSNQDDVVKQLCHWLSYKIPNAPAGKEYVPVAVATSSDPAINADSDYNHWMSVVGIKVNQDPFPDRSDSATFKDLYAVPESLTLEGLYLNDPGQAGLGFHTYIAANEWLTRYFRPIAAGLEDQGSYVAIMEPPSSDAAGVDIEPADENKDLHIILSTAKSGVSLFIPRWVDRDVKQYLISLLTYLKKSDNFITLIDDAYFSDAFRDSIVNRCFKVDGKLQDPYTIVPFDKHINGKIFTTAAVLVNNRTGQFQLAAADPVANGIFKPISIISSYRRLRREIGWRRREHPIEFWLSHSKGSALAPGWSIVIAVFESKHGVDVVGTKTYIVPVDGEIVNESFSPRVELTDVKVYNDGGWIKMVVFKVTSADVYTIDVDTEKNCTSTNLYQDGDDWLVIVQGRRKASCRVKIKGVSSGDDLSHGGISYLYIR